jgi:RNA polymerase sigma-B factor
MTSAAMAEPVRASKGPDERLPLEDVLARFRAMRSSNVERDREQLRDELIGEHRWLSMHCARRFARRGEPFDDLFQVAQMGMVKAVDRFDPDHGVAFSTFAVPTMLGELRRHFRDRTWSLRVPRRAKELHLEMTGAVERLQQRLQRAPSVDEIAIEMGATVEDVLEAMEAGAAYRTSSIVPPDSGGDDSAVESSLLWSDDADLERAEQRVALRQLLSNLPERERQILYMRFYEDRTQSEIAEEVGMSQVHVSRLLRSSFEQLRRIMRDANASEQQGS